MKFFGERSVERRERRKTSITSLILKGPICVDSSFLRALTSIESVSKNPNDRGKPHCGEGLDTETNRRSHA